MKQSIAEYTLYAKRYLIGYTALFFVVVSVLAIAALYVPGALRQGEIDSALTSGALSFQSIEPHTVINLPYYLLQRVSFIFFGVSTLSIKLPSILLGALTVVGVFILARLWFRRTIVIIVTAIGTTTAQFMFLVQDGTPNILFSFVTIWLLVACTYVTRAKYFTTFWKVTAGVLIATALYIPLGLYVVLALLVTALTHPHIRYQIRRVSRIRMIVAILLGLIALAPLVYSVIIAPTVGLTLLGIPTAGIDLQESVPAAGRDLFGFFSNSNGYLLRPLYSLGLVMILCIGVYRLLTIKYTARSYAILIITGFIGLLSLVDPTHTLALYPMAILISAIGFDALVTSWYKLFPYNPYARVAGLVPIAILLVGLALSGVGRYLNDYTYNPSILSHYSLDLAILDKQLTAAKTTVQLVASEKEVPFYALVAHYDKRLSLVASAESEKDMVIVTAASYKASPPARDIDEIVTSSRASDADRFYIYKSTAN